MNYFFTSQESGYHHLVIYITNLVNQGALKEGSIKVLVTGENSDKNIREFPTESIDVSAIKHPLRLCENDTMTFLSLNEYNVIDVRKILSENSSNISNTYCLITDDEVERWLNTKKEQSSSKSFLSELNDPNLLYCLQNIGHYICEYNPWGEIIKKTLELPGHVIDVLPPFTIELFDKEISMCANNSNRLGGDSVLKVMFYTKKKEHHEIADLIKYFRRCDLATAYPRIEIIFWCDPITRNLSCIVEIIRLKMLLKKNGIQFNINYISFLPVSIYLQLMIEQDVLFCQPRGGASAIRAFIRSGGLPIFCKESLNYL
ncbi:hypothetical protein HN777_04330, partial [Candidatus Woesearchaeota archaeon]|nr:hypothetical protein [Candidatus Woesearchaeota archaeon]